MREARIDLGGDAPVMARAVPGGWAVGGRVVPDDAVRFRPVVDATVYGVILNDADTLAAWGDALHAPPYLAAPRAPVLYVKPRNTLAAHGEPVRLPPGAATVDVCGALALVFDRPVTRAGAADALDHVLGYTVAIDLTLPHASVHRPPIREKCFDGACPIGPWRVDRAHVADPDGLEIRVYVNGVLAQARSLRRLLRPVARLVADVSEFMTLGRGETLLAGVAAGAPRARPGDVVAVEIPGVGRIESPLAGSEA